MLVHLLLITLQCLPDSELSKADGSQSYELEQFINKKIFHHAPTALAVAYCKRVCKVEIQRLPQGFPKASFSTSLHSSLELPQDPNGGTFLAGAQS
jgi:hypothetical protein